MRNSRNAVVYFLFLASQKPVAKKIMCDIFKRYTLQQSGPHCQVRPFERFATSQAFVKLDLCKRFSGLA
jgi:hypothetical protein